MSPQILQHYNSQNDRELADCLAPPENKIRRNVETPIQLMWKAAVALQAHWLCGVSSLGYYCRAPVLPPLLPSRTSLLSWHKSPCNCPEGWSREMLLPERKMVLSGSFSSLLGSPCAHTNSSACSVEEMALA